MADFTDDKIVIQGSNFNVDAALEKWNREGKSIRARAPCKCLFWWPFFKSNAEPTHATDEKF